MNPSFASLKDGSPSRDELLHFYDSLPSVPSSEMVGVWRGADWRTGGRFDGLLERTNWYGKVFRSADDVDALVFSRPTTLLSLLNWLVIWPFRLPEAPGKARHPFGKARLREVMFRGAVSAAMCYDYLPIIDHFRQVDHNTVMGLMDFKGRPDSELFFRLERVTDRAVTRA